MDEDAAALCLSYLAGVLDHSDSGGVESNIQSVKDVDHKLPHGFKLMWPNAAGAVNEEDQIHWTGLTLLLRSWEITAEQSTSDG